VTSIKSVLAKNIWVTERVKLITYILHTRGWPTVIQLHFTQIVWIQGCIIQAFPCLESTFKSHLWQFNHSGVLKFFIFESISLYYWNNTKQLLLVSLFNDYNKCDSHVVSWAPYDSDEQQLPRYWKEIAVFETQCYHMSWKYFRQLLAKLLRK
jgi:hypothetical protein